MRVRLRGVFFVFWFAAASLFGQAAFGQAASGQAASGAPQVSATTSQSAPAGQFSPDAKGDIVAYIHKTWGVLQRSMNECASIADAKFGSDARAVLYLPQTQSGPQIGPAPPAVQQLKSRCRVQVERLPLKISRLGEVMPDQLKVPGLLYLPNPYVVPGGRFNEMYGWDSYFIIRGLLEEGERDLTRGMIENFFYEIENYGAVLNANRTYYLTRSQPPFLTSMVMAQYAADTKAGRGDTLWLKKAYEYSKRDYALWTHNPKLAGQTGLSRYFDIGDGPVPDIADHSDYYADVADWLVRHPEVHTDYLARGQDGVGPVVRVPLCGKQPCARAPPVQFTAGYYKGDRAMRESGFDISFRFGPFGGSTQEYAPVCLNSLLYKEEKDLAEMAQLLGYSQEAQNWRMQAEQRKALVNRYLWNVSRGMFFDYDATTGKQSSYDFATTFYPLWSGLATPEQARSVMKNLGVFEQPGGIAMSDMVTGVQWDKPYGWAPVEMIAVEGMRRYGFRDEADRVSREFLTMVIENFRRDGTIREKYNVVARSTDVIVTAGYKENIAGFGWTNGVFLVLLRALPTGEQGTVLEIR